MNPHCPVSAWRILQAPWSFTRLPVFKPSGGRGQTPQPPSFCPSSLTPPRHLDNKVPPQVTGPLCLLPAPQQCLLLCLCAQARPFIPASAGPAQGWEGIILEAPLWNEPVSLRNSNSEAKRPLSAIKGAHAATQTPLLSQAFSRPHASAANAI